MHRFVCKSGCGSTPYSGKYCGQTVPFIDQIRLCVSYPAVCDPALTLIECEGDDTWIAVGQFMTFSRRQS